MRKFKIKKEVVMNHYICFRSSCTETDESMPEQYEIGASSSEEARVIFAAEREEDGFSAELSDTSEEVFLRKNGVEFIYYGFVEP